MTDKEKSQEIVTVEFERQTNFGANKVTREFNRLTAEKGIKSKAGAWKNARIVTKPVEVDLGLKKKEVKTEPETEENEPVKKTGPKPKKETTEE